MLATVKQLQNEPVPIRAAGRREISSPLRFCRWDWTVRPRLLGTLAHFINMRGSPETINKRYALYQGVTPADVQRVAKQVLVESERTIATLRHAPEGGAE